MTVYAHWNMALLAVSAARLSRLQDQRACPLVFSMEDKKRRAYNEFCVERILSILAVKPTDENCRKLIGELLTLGVKAD